MKQFLAAVQKKYGHKTNVDFYGKKELECMAVYCQTVCQGADGLASIPVPTRERGRSCQLSRYSHLKSKGRKNDSMGNNFN